MYVKGVRIVHINEGTVEFLLTENDPRKLSPAQRDEMVRRIQACSTCTQIAMCCLARKMKPVAIKPYNDVWFSLDAGHRKSRQKQLLLPAPKPEQIMTENSVEPTNSVEVETVITKVAVAAGSNGKEVCV